MYERVTAKRIAVYLHPTRSSCALTRSNLIETEDAASRVIKSMKVHFL